jgi:ATP-dependent Lon protease
MSDLFAKIRRVFGDYAVDKKLILDIDIPKIPRFVAEYLVTEFSTGEDWERKLREFIVTHYYEVGEKEKLRHRLIQEGKVEIMDELRVWVDLNSGEHRGVIPSLGVSNALVVDEIADKYQATMQTGMWGLITLQYDQNVPTDSRGRPIRDPVIVTNFEPFQVPDTDPKILQEARSHFTLEEWIDVLINTLGLNHEKYKFKEKVTILLRLLPLVEENLNLAEFGPRATGKTYTFRNSSMYVRIIAGGNISPASLFYNLRTGMPGEIAVKDCVVFDEISKVRFQNPDEMVAKLKDFMESGHFERGARKGVSGCSLVFMGNVEVEKRERAYIPVEDLTYILPQPMRDSALIDRIHGLIPGWEIPKIGRSRAYLSQGYGIASDYFSEAMHSMRKMSLAREVSKHVEFSENFTIRDEKAIKKILSAMVKLFFPDLAWDKKELELISNIALEMRQKIRDWLHRFAPGEFPKERLDIRIRG